MKKRGRNLFLATLLITVVFAVPVLGAEVQVSVTNLTHGSFFTPLLITAHGGAFHLFQPGEPAGQEIQAMAEGGSIAGLSSLVGGPDADTVENPNGGPLAPGGMTSTTINTNATGNRYLSIVAMILPTNDGFVGLNSLEIPTEPGTYTYTLNAYDAGTEANNELVAENGGVPGTPGFPSPPPIGVTQTGGAGVTNMETNTMVHIHRGILGDTDPVGGVSDIDSTKFRWLNPVARLTLTIN